MEVVTNNQTSGKYLTAEELKSIQDMNADLTRAKTALGELDLQKHNLLKHIDELKSVFAQTEKMLVEKYGENAVINIKTGEVTDNKANNNT
jgi:hypothetical protein